MGRIASEGTEEGFADAALLSEMRAGNSTAFAAFESGGNRYVRPTATAPHLDSTSGGNRAVALECQLSPDKPTMRQVKSIDSRTLMPMLQCCRQMSPHPTCGGRPKCSVHRRGSDQPTSPVRSSACPRDPGFHAAPPCQRNLRVARFTSRLGAGSSRGSAHLGSKSHRFPRWGLVAGAERRRLRRQDFEWPPQMLWRRRGEAAARR